MKRSGQKDFDHRHPLEHPARIEEERPFGPLQRTQEIIDETFHWPSPSNILVRDDKGRVADITFLDVNRSNGVIHVIDEVLMP